MIKKIRRRETRLEKRNTFVSSTIISYERIRADRRLACTEKRRNQFFTRPRTFSPIFSLSTDRIYTARVYLLKLGEIARFIGTAAVSQNRKSEPDFELGEIDFAVRSPKTKIGKNVYVKSRVRKSHVEHFLGTLVNSPSQSGPGYVRNY